MFMNAPKNAAIGQSEQQADPDRDLTQRDEPGLVAPFNSTLMKSRYHS